MANNPQNIIPNSERTPEERKEIARAGGIKSGQVRRERKTIAEVLRRVLDEPAAAGSDRTRLDAVVEKTVKGLYDNPNANQLKTIAELLGELEHKVKVDGPAVALLPQDEIDTLKDLAK
ncbi:MAG: hypothetical protein IKE76_09490 [Clostridia bacterium]|nr:hypothetical protein [Clostridia bacterium]